MTLKVDYLVFREMTATGILLAKHTQFVKAIDCNKSARSENQHDQVEEKGKVFILRL